MTDITTRAHALSSSPLSSPPLSSEPRPFLSSSQSQSQPRRTYHPPKPLPFELSQHILIYLEETLYLQAFNFLISLLSSCSHASPNTPAYTPSPIHLSIAATLSTHPALTSRTTSREKHEQANLAFRLLRLTHQLVGPIGADFKTALSFNRRSFSSTRNHGIFRNETETDSTTSSSHAENQKIDSAFSTTESLFSRAEDFWHLIGWAFNCSCLALTMSDPKARAMYAARWERWTAFLEFMFSVLEDDWSIHHAEQKWEQSLIWHYVSAASGTASARDRRILRSIFADGSQKSTNEFREVYRNELKEPKADAGKVKRREVDVNVEAEVYGDYLAAGGEDDELEEEGFEEDITANAEPQDIHTVTITTRSSAKRMRTREPSSRRPTPKTSNTNLRQEHPSNTSATNDTTITTSTTTVTDGTLPLGGLTSLTLRLRLLHLLSYLATQPPSSLPSPPPLDPSSLYTLLTTHILPLPFPTFSLLTSPTFLTPDFFSPDAHTTLLELLLQHLLEPGAPSIRTEPYLTQEKLETFYLPYAAGGNGVVENAKVGVLLEGCVRHLWHAGKLGGRRRLGEVVERGCRRREEKAFGGRGGRGLKGEEGREAAEWLRESGERMGDIVRRLK